METKLIFYLFEHGSQLSRWNDNRNIFSIPTHLFCRVLIGDEISEGNGSRMRIVLNDRKAVFHRPHPKRETDKGALKSVRQFLENAGIKK